MLCQVSDKKIQDRYRDKRNKASETRASIVTQQEPKWNLMRHMQIRFASSQGNGPSSTRDCLSKRGSGESKQTDPAIARVHLHEAVVDGNNKDLAGIFEFSRVDISGNMVLRASGRVGGRNTCK